MNSHDLLQQRLSQLRQAVTVAEKKFKRPPGAVNILAVSKNKSVADITLALALGQMDFGESYAQEALLKINALENHTPRPIWHFIGNIQSNKTTLIAKHFSWVHSINSLKAAERLHKARPLHLPPLNVLIEVNIDQETSKTGLAEEEVKTLAHALQPLNHLRLRGLMAIPKKTDQFDDSLKSYHKVTALQQRLIQSGLQLDSLSLGMSHDFVAAIAAGSTWVRIGQAIFGARS